MLLVLFSAIYINNASFPHLHDDDHLGRRVGMAAHEAQHVDAHLARRLLGDGHRQLVAVLLARAAVLAALVLECLQELGTLSSTIKILFQQLYTMMKQVLLKATLHLTEWVQQLKLKK